MAEMLSAAPRGVGGCRPEFAGSGKYPRRLQSDLILSTGQPLQGTDEGKDLANFLPPSALPRMALFSPAPCKFLQHSN